MLDLAFKSFSVHIDLSNEEKEVFSSLAKVEHVDRKVQVLQAGKVCKYEYFVLKGCLRSYYIDDDLIEHSTLFATEGWWTGNLKSFVRNVPSDFYLETLESSIVLKLSKIQSFYFGRNIPIIFINSLHFRWIPHI